MIILCGIHVKIKLYYFLFYMVFNTTFLVFCNYSKSFIKYNNSRNLILTSTDKSCRITFVVRQAQLAQLVEQRTENPCVSGSIPITRFFVTLFCLSTKYFVIYLSCRTAAFTHTYTQNKSRYTVSPRNVSAFIMR